MFRVFLGGLGCFYLLCKEQQNHSSAGGTLTHGHIMIGDKNQRVCNTGNGSVLPGSNYSSN